MAEDGPRALDHLVLPCADLAAAARDFADFGFTVGRRNRHPWGTENHIVQVPGAFLELIALAPDYRPLPPDDDAFPFTGFLAGQGASRSPSGMVVLRSADAAADAAAFVTAGIGSGRMLRFARDAQAPDGTTRTVAFSLAFAEAPAMPDLGFFVCQQHHPEYFWSVVAQRHANGVSGIAAVVLTAATPADHASVLSRLVGGDAVVTPEGGVAIELGDGTRLEVAAGDGPPRLTAIRFRTSIPRASVRFGRLDLLFEAEQR